MASQFVGHEANGQASSSNGTSQAPAWPNMFGLAHAGQASHQQQQSTMNQQSYIPRHVPPTTSWDTGTTAAYAPAPAPAGTSFTGTGTTEHKSDSVLDLFASMPSAQDDPTRHQMWTELVRYKTRALELQIAEAKTKEKEAEAELLRLKDMYQTRGGRQSFSQHLDPASNHQSNSQPVMVQQQYTQQQQSFVPQTDTTNTDIFGLGSSHNNVGQSYQPTPTHQPLSKEPPTSMTTFDLEAMMQNNNLDNLFSWLPDFGDTAQTLQVQQSHSHGIDPNDLLTSSGPTPAPGPGDPQYQPFYNQLISTPMSVKPTITSPPTRRSRTPDDDEPASKKTKRPEKKTLVEHTSACTVCARPLARTIIRAPKSQIPEQVAVEFTCTQCRPVAQPPALNDVPASGSGIGTVDTRKRLRIAMEAEDEDKHEHEHAARRAFCDVCQRVFGSGSVFGGHERENLGYMTEIICSSCDHKYSRCTDCGGGGGGRMGIGKWRMKQVFQPGRKTCSLSHTRLGDRPREIGVHVTPTDFTPEQLREVLSRCKQLWNEKTLARLAVPEMLEIDLPPQLQNPIRNYQDVEEIVTRNWPNRESMIRAEGAEPTRFKRLLGLVWAHSKSRRGTRTVDIEEEWHKTAEGEDDDDMSTVLDNVKRTNLVIPGGSELIGMWGGEWDMKHGALLVSTFIPFEGTDGEDSTALSVGEMITKVQAMRQEINQARKEDAAKRGVQPDLVPQCEHLWVVSGGAMPLVRERIADILIRKRSFVHVDEYLTRHPDFINALKARPVGLHPDILRESPHARDTRPPPLILVRWLGKDFDAQKILEIKQAEFGGKAKLKKKPKVK